MNNQPIFTPAGAAPLKQTPLKDLLYEAARLIHSEITGQRIELDNDDFWDFARRLSDFAPLFRRHYKRPGKYHQELIWQIYKALFYYQDERGRRGKPRQPFSPAELTAMLDEIELFIRQL